MVRVNQACEGNSLHIPGYLISPLTGWSIKIIHELRHFMRLLLLNINYLRHYFLSKPCRKILWILNTLPNGVIHHNMPLSTTNILIVSVSFPYRSPIVLLLFSYWEAETIRKQYGIERRINEWGTVEQRWLILLLSKSQRQWQDSNKLLWVSTCHLSTYYLTKVSDLVPNERNYRANRTQSKLLELLRCSR